MSGRYQALLTYVAADFELILSTVRSLVSDKMSRSSAPDFNNVFKTQFEGAQTSYGEYFSKKNSENKNCSKKIWRLPTFSTFFWHKKSGKNRLGQYFFFNKFFKTQFERAQISLCEYFSKTNFRKQNLFKTHLGRVNFFVVFSNIKKVEKVDPPHIFFEQFLFSEIFFWEIFPIWNLSSFKLGFKNIVKIRSTTSRHFIRYDWTHCSFEKRMLVIQYKLEVTARVLAESVPMIFGTRALLKRALVLNACRTHRVLSTLKSTR